MTDGTFRIVVSRLVGARVHLHARDQATTAREKREMYSVLVALTRAAGDLATAGLAGAGVETGSRNGLGARCASLVGPRQSNPFRKISSGSTTPPAPCRMRSTFAIAVASLERNPIVFVP